MESKIANIVYDLSKLSVRDLSLESESVESEEEESEEESEEEEIERVLYESPLIRGVGRGRDGEEQREVKISMVLSKFGVWRCYQRLRKRVCRTDCDGFIYVYSSDKYRGMFKVGRSKELPRRRVKMQERKNCQVYTLKKSFFCCLHKLVEKCVHTELRDVNHPLEVAQDGYTEWFDIEWAPLEAKIKNVIKAIQELLASNLLYLPIPY